MSKPKTIEQRGSKKASNSGASKSQSSERQSKGNKELKNVTVYVSVKGVTARVAIASKETMSHGALKTTNKKENKFAKKMMQQQLRL